MLSLVYASVATKPFSDQDLSDLLAWSRDWNRSIGVTGLLLYKDGQFMQNIEGEDDAVEELFAAVAKDPRHTNVTPLLRTQVQHRQYPDWTMGFRTLSDEMLADIPGYDDFFQTRRDPSGWGTETRARWLLEWFRTHDVAGHGTQSTS